MRRREEEFFPELPEAPVLTPDAGKNSLCRRYCRRLPRWGTHRAPTSSRRKRRQIGARGVAAEAVNCTIFYLLYFLRQRCETWPKSGMCQNVGVLPAANGPPSGT